MDSSMNSHEPLWKWFVFLASIAAGFAVRYSGRFALLQTGKLMRRGRAYQPMPKLLSARTCAYPCMMYMALYDGAPACSLTFILVTRCLGEILCGVLEKVGASLLSPLFKASTEE